MKLYYKCEYDEDIYIGYILSNMSMTIDEILNLFEFDLDEFALENGFDNIDFEKFYVIYD